MDVVWTDLHRRQNPKMEINLGQPIPTYERPDRAETIRQQLETDSRFNFVGLAEHGRSPIEAVHALGPLALLQTWHTRSNFPRDLAGLPWGYLAASIARTVRA